MTIPIRVLVVEDSLADLKLLLRALRQGGFDPQYEQVQTEDEMRLELRRNDWDIVISDYRMPAFTAPHALEILKEIRSDLPFIIVSGTIGETHAVEAMRAGAHDYVMKDNMTRLVPAITRELAEAQMRRERRQAENALRESEARFRNMADSAPMLLWVSDKNARREYVNKPWLEFTGRKMEDEMGTGWMGNISPADRSACFAAYQAAFTDRKPFQIEYRMLRCDNQWRWIVDSGIPRFQSDGSFAGFIGTCIDLTERKQAEFERESMRIENERLMAEQVANAVRQRTFLKDILYSVTEGRLSLCDTPEELPRPLPGTPEAIPITPESLRSVRKLTEQAAALYGLSDEGGMDLVTAASEASMNAAVHGGGGESRIYGADGKVQVWVEDQGKGIDIGHLPRATLERGYSTANSLGHGFYLMLSCADNIFLLTGPKGTTVVLEKNRVTPEPAWMSRFAA